MEKGSISNISAWMASNAAESWEGRNYFFHPGPVGSALVRQDYWEIGGFWVPNSLGIISEVPFRGLDYKMLDW